MGPKLDGLKRRVTKRAATPCSILRGFIILISGVTLIIFECAEHYKQFYGFYKYVEAALVTSCFVTLFFLILNLFQPYPCCTQQQFWVFECFIHFLWGLILVIAAIMCYVRSYDQNLLITSSIGSGISAVIHLCSGVFLFVKQRRLAKAAEDQRKINQSDLEKIKAAQRGDNPQSEKRMDDYRSSNDDEVQNDQKIDHQPGIGGF